MKTELELIVANKCSKCKIKELDKCEGQFVIKGANLIMCPSFVDVRASMVIKENLYIPFPISIKKARKKK